MTELFDKPVFNKNNSSKSAFSRNDNSKLVFRKNDDNNEINKFDINKNGVRYAKKSEKLKSEKMSKF